MNTVNMKTSNVKNKVLGLSIGLVMLSASVMTTSVQAAEPTTESVVTEFVVAQSKQLMNEVSVQLQQSITQELKSFSVDSAVSWLVDEEQFALNSTVKTTEKKQLNNESN